MNDIVVFLILAGIALVFKWLGSASESETPPTNSSSAPNDAPSPRPTERPPAESEQERIRRFLEALGAPPGSAPPPPVGPRPAPQRRVVTPRAQTPPKVKRGWAQPLPPLVTIPEPVAGPAFPPPAPVSRPISPPIVTVAPPPAPPLVPLVRPGVFPAASPRPPLSLGELLRSAGSARQAIVLREVLGPPRSLQPLGGDGFL